MTYFKEVLAPVRDQNGRIEKNVKHELYDAAFQAKFPTIYGMGTV